MCFTSRSQRRWSLKSERLEQSRSAPSCSSKWPTLIVLLVIATDAENHAQFARVNFGYYRQFQDLTFVNTCFGET
ncbi:hypothetical protein Plhal304r1_c058g0144701 [Plasmopara halstedii]